MSQFRNPKESNPLKHIQDLTILPDIKPNIVMEVEAKVDIELEEKPISPEDIYGAGISKDTIESNTPEPCVDISIPKKRGRGKDKIKRKKKVMTEVHLEALVRGRKTSQANRTNTANQKKKVVKEALENLATKNATPKIDKPKPAEKLDYETFSRYMNKYVETRKQKHWVKSSETHPNKVINPRLRPVPPISKPQILPKQIQSWNGNISQYQVHKKGRNNSRWQYGI